MTHHIYLVIPSKHGRTEEHICEAKLISEGIGWVRFHNSFHSEQAALEFAEEHQDSWQGRDIIITKSFSKPT